MGKRRRQKKRHDLSATPSDVSGDNSSTCGSFTKSKEQRKKMNSVSPGLKSDTVKGTLLPVGTQSVGFIVTNQNAATDIEDKHAGFTKDNRSKKSSTTARRLNSQDPMAVMTVQQDLMMPTFSIYDTSRKDDTGRISPVFDRKPTLGGDDNLDKDMFETDRLTPPFMGTASRSGSGDFGDISTSGSLFQIMSEDRSTAYSETTDGEREEDWQSSPDGRGEREREHTQEGEEEGEDEDDRETVTPSKAESEGFVLQFSLAKVLAHRAAEKMRSRIKKGRHHREKLNIPDIGLTSGLVDVTSEAALEIRLAHSQLEDLDEDQDGPAKHGPKILVSLFPHGKQRWRKADYIPVDIIGGKSPDLEDDGEVAADAGEVQQRESLHDEDGTAENDQERSGTELQMESVSTFGQCVGSMRSDSRSRRSYVGSQMDSMDVSSHRYSVITEEGVTRFDSQEEAASCHLRPADDSMTLMNLVRNFMEDTLVRSHQSDSVHGHGYTDVTEAHQLVRQNLARERAMAVVRATSVQCDDIFATLTDEEMIARLLIRRVLRDSVALVKEMDHQENMDAAAKAIADEILAQLDDKMKVESHDNQRHFSICIESPLTEPLHQSEVKLRVEYPSDDESEMESGTTELKPESKQRRRQVLYASHKGRHVSSHGSANVLHLQTWKPLPPIGSRASTEDVGETSCDSQTVLTSVSGHERLRGRMVDHSRRLHRGQLKKDERPVTEGICKEERRSLHCYDGVTRVMLSLATQTDLSWMETDAQRPGEAVSRHGNRMDLSPARHEHISRGRTPGIVISHSDESVRSARSSQLPRVASDTQVEVGSSKDRGLKIPNLHIPESSDDEAEDRKSPRKGMRPTEVGPPHIIKYTKESVSPVRMHAADFTEKEAGHTDRAMGVGLTDKEKEAGYTDKEKDVGLTDKMTEADFAEKTKGADLMNKMKGAALTDKAFIAYNNKYNWTQGGVFHGTCEFCQHDILPYPTDAERLKAKDPDKLFCCRDYEQFVRSLISDTETIKEDVIGHVLRRIDKREVKGSPERIDIRSQQQKFHSDEEAKRHAAERMKERELQRQQKASDRGQRGHRMGANFHHGDQGKTESTMSFSLSLTLAKVKTAGKSFPHPIDHHSRRMDGHSRRMTMDPQQYSDYHHRPSGHAREHVIRRRQTGDDPHFSEARRMMAGHHLGTYTPSDYSYQSNVSESQRTRRGRDVRSRHQGMSQRKHSLYGSDHHRDHRHGRDASHDRLRSGRRHSRERRLSRESRHSGRQVGDRRQRGYHGDDSYDTVTRHGRDVSHDRLRSGRRHSRERRLSRESRHSGRQVGDRRQRGYHGDYSDPDFIPGPPSSARRNVYRRPIIMKQLLKNVKAPPWPSADPDHFEVREGQLQPKAPDYSDMADFEPEPVLPPWAVSEVCDGQVLDIDALRQTKTLVTKYYPHDKLFLVLFPDGTGSVFYPSGKLAITIASVARGFYIYIVQDKHGNIMGVFDGLGHAYTNYRNAKLRLCLDQKGGLELDWRGGQKRKWLWRGQEEHVHAPPLQPITFAITNHAAVRLMAQDNITLTFNCWSRACRFQVGARLRPTKHFVAHKAPLDEVALMRDETKTHIEAILSRVANLLRFPHCTTVDKMALPLFIRATIERQEHMRAVLQATAKGLDIESSVFVN